ncbi:MAG: tyrosine-type recombinase/integrase [Nitrospirae bacterium]|nr:tyrosine-type recombinase/integrase [Nitrospirota bacterium]
MSVRKRNNKFVIDYYPQGRAGKRVRMTLPDGVTDIKDAQAVESELRASKDKHTPIPRHATVSDLFTQYLDYYEMHRAPTTYRDIKGVFKNHIKKHLGHYLAAEISEHHINVYKRLRRAEHPSGNRCINKELHYFSGFLSWASHPSRKYIPKRDFIIEQLPYTRPIPIVLTYNEAIRFIKAAEPLYRVFFLVLFNLGLRRTSARLLKWTDIDLSHRTLQIIGKGGKANRLPLSGWLYRELKALRKKSKSPWVFPSPRVKDKPIYEVRNAIARAKKKAGITKRIHSHLLRHSLATHLLDKDINLETIRDMLDHKDVTTTAFYTHVSTKIKESALKKAGFK